MNRKPIKTIRSYAGHARFLQHECVLDNEGLAVFVREIPRDRSIPSPYVFSQTEFTTRLHDGREVIIRETSHRCYQVFEV